MASSDSFFNIILLTTDRSLQRKLERHLKDAKISAVIMVARNLASVKRAAAKRPADGIFIDANRDSGRGDVADLAEVQKLVDPSRTFILTGSPEKLLEAVRTLGQSATLESLDHEVVSSNGSPNGSLEDYFDTKLGDFVRGMKYGSAKDLHPMLIKTVERPLITHALRVTNGNQIKTAHLLGMNRNTLRKKITELRIPVHRERARRS